MNHRTLGDSDVEVSEIGFGAWVAPPVGADDPRAEADLRDLHAGVAQRSVVHTRT